MEQSNKGGLKKRQGKSKTSPPSNNNNKGKKGPVGGKSQAVKLLKAEAVAQTHAVEQKMDESFILRSITRGNQKKVLTVTRTTGGAELAMNILAFASFIAQYSYEFTAAQANQLLGVLWDDARRAILGLVPLMEKAPRVWWEYRHSLTPTTSGHVAFSYTDPGTSVTYAPATSFSFLGNQNNLKVDIGTSVGAQNYYTAIDSTLANYEAFSKFINAGAKVLKVCANPFEGKTNTDPSGYAFYNLLARANGFGASATATNDHLDWNRNLEVPIKSRWLAATGLGAVATTTAPTPMYYSTIASSGSTEIGHRLYCVANGAPKHIREAIPVAMPVSAYALIDKTLMLFSKALLAGGVASGSLTKASAGFGLQELASYLYGMLFEWFAPWSTVAYPRGKQNSNGIIYYCATSGCMVQNLWRGKPLPAPLALNLSFLVPCYDAKAKRMYYPILAMDCTPASFDVGQYAVWAAGNNGTASWSSATGQAFYLAYDVNGTVAQGLGKYASYFPLRTLPHPEMTFSLACHLVMPAIDATNLGNYWVVFSAEEPSQEERELFAIFVMPYLEADIVEVNMEQMRMNAPKFLSTLQVYNNFTSYTDFIITNGNMVNSGAKVLLDQYDYVQEIAQAKASSGSNSSWFYPSNTQLTLGTAAASFGVGGFKLWQTLAASGGSLFDWIPGRGNLAKNKVGYDLLGKMA